MYTRTCVYNKNKTISFNTSVLCDTHGKFSMVHRNANGASEASKAKEIMNLVENCSKQHE